MKLSKETKEKYDCLAHSKTRLVYHVIFSTKYRRKALEPIKEDVLESVRYAESQSDFKVLYMNTDGDHLHMLIRCRPAFSVEQIVRRLKHLSTRWLWEKDGEYLRKFYWKRKQVWTGGYFAATVGDVSERGVAEYIEKQGLCR
jgi:putative transposase